MTEATSLSSRLGRWGLGGATFGREIDRDAAFAIMDYAIARGTTHLDTAAAYSQGESERIVGAWLQKRGPSKAPLVATKIKPPYTAQQIRQSISDSRERLGVTTIDLLYAHQWTDELAGREALEEFGEAVASGAVRHLGLSNVQTDSFRAALDVQRRFNLPQFNAIQNNHNFAVRDVDEAMRSLCEQHDVAIVTYSPLGAGFLTGKHREGVAAGSRFDIMPGHQKVYFHDVAWRRLAELEAIAQRTSEPMPHLALIWALNQFKQGTVLIGGRSTGHIDQALAALDVGRPSWIDEVVR